MAFIPCIEPNQHFICYKIRKRKKYLRKVFSGQEVIEDLSRCKQMLEN